MGPSSGIVAGLGQGGHRRQGACTDALTRSPREVTLLLPSGCDDLMLAPKGREGPGGPLWLPTHPDHRGMRTLRALGGARHWPFLRPPHMVSMGSQGVRGGRSPCF